MRAFWLLWPLACAVWAVGETVWGIYEVALRRAVPYPSIADAAYLAGTPLAVAAFACHPAARVRHGHWVPPLLECLAVSVAVLLAGWTIVLEPLWEVTGPSLGDVVMLSYPIGDVAMITLVLLALRYLPAANWRSTLALLSGLVIVSVTDAYFTVVASAGSYQSGDLVDVGWFASYVMFALAGAFDQPTSATDDAPPAPAPRWAGLVPFAPVLGVLGVRALRLARSSR